MIKTKLIDIPIYDQKLMLVDCDNIKELHSLFKETSYNSESNYKTDTDIFARAIGSSVKIKKNYYNCIYVVLNRNHIQPLSIGDLAHEAIHVIQLLYDLIGEEFADVKYTVEHEAYHMGYFMSELCKFMGVKEKIKRKKK